MTDQINARDYIFQVESATPDTWVDILGKTKFTIKMSEKEEVADTTTFESDGDYESQPMQRGASLTLEGMYLRSSANVRDPGQARMDTLALAKTEAALSRLRFRHTIETDWTIWPGWASLADQGGETNKKGGWGFTWNKSGAASMATVA
ncbi:MAG: phage tail tube protein [Gloeomargaritales cyanobacterium]